MRDHMRDDARFGAPECAEVELRDALPALDHGRLSDRDRRRLERHLEECAACEAELALLRDVRLLTTSGAPVLDLDRIAAGVRGATVRPGPGVLDERVAALARRRERPRGTARPAWVTRLTSGAGLRAAAALLIAAVGGAVVATRGQESVPPIAPQGAVVAAPTVSPAAPAGSAGGIAGDTAGHALGDRFPDLSEDELSAVLVALEDDDAALPALEPAMLAPEYRGGGE
jgi:anti-sigma factor RsiW